MAAGRHTVRHIQGMWAGCCRAAAGSKGLSRALLRGIVCRGGKGRKGDATQSTARRIGAAAAERKAHHSSTVQHHRAVCGCIEWPNTAVHHAAKHLQDVIAFRPLQLALCQGRSCTHCLRAHTMPVPDGCCSSPSSSGRDASLEGSLPPSYCVRNGGTCDELGPVAGGQGKRIWARVDKAYIATPVLGQVMHSDYCKPVLSA